MKKLKNILFYLISGIIYFVMTVIIALLCAIFLEPEANNFLIRNFASNNPPSTDIYEVIIDDYSIMNYKWPWNKDKYADILDYFYTYSKPKVIGLDMFAQTFSKNGEPDEYKYINQISKMDNLVSAFIPSVEGNEEYDFLKKHSIDIDLRTNIADESYNSFGINSQKLKKATKNYGSVKVPTNDIEQNLYDFSNIVKIKDKYYPSLALKMYLLANNTNKLTIDDKFIYNSKTNLKLPYTYSDATLKSLIRYYYNPQSDYSHQSISASRILDSYYALKSGITPKTNPEKFGNDKLINPKIFKNKIIIIGSNLSGPSQDVIKTPMNPRHPGIDVQATIFDNLNSGHYLEFYWEISIISLLLLSLFAFVFIFKFKFLKGLISLVILDLIYLAFAGYMASTGKLISLAIPIGVQFISAIFGYSFKFLIENRNKEKIKQAMGKYISQDVMKNVVKNIDNLSLGGKRAVVTVLFSDIRGFTSLSEKMSAEDVSKILNEYFKEMEPIITKYNGIINKFIGDAVMAIFGEPINDDNHPQNAVKCACEMLQKLNYLKEKWLNEGKPKIEIGIGINTGEVFIGNIGTETRMEYTVIGDTVNLASRIESYNKTYKTNLLVSTSTYSYIKDIADVIKISDVQIRGKAKKTDIYEVLKIKY